MTEQEQIKALGIGQGTLAQKTRTHQDPFEPPQPVIVKDAPAFPILSAMAKELEKHEVLGPYIALFGDGLVGIDSGGAFRRAYDEANGIAPDAAALDELERQREEHYRATQSNPRAGEVTLWDVTLRDEAANYAPPKAVETGTSAAEAFSKTHQARAGGYGGKFDSNSLIDRHAAINSAINRRVAEMTQEPVATVDILAVTRSMCK